MKQSPGRKEKKRRLSWPWPWQQTQFYELLLLLFFILLGTFFVNKYTYHNVINSALNAESDQFAQDVAKALLNSYSGDEFSRQLRSLAEGRSFGYIATISSPDQMILTSESQQGVRESPSGISDEDLDQLEEDLSSIFSSDTVYDEGFEPSENTDSWLLALQNSFRDSVGFVQSRQWENHPSIYSPKATLRYTEGLLQFDVFVPMSNQLLSSAGSKAYEASIMFLIVTSILAGFILTELNRKRAQRIMRMLPVSQSAYLERTGNKKLYDPYDLVEAQLANFLEEHQHRLNEMKSLSGSVAHELRTPLSILQARLDQVIREQETGSDTQQVLSGLMEEVNRIKNTTEKLLLLARFDEANLDLYLHEINLKETVESIAEDLQIIRPEMKIRVDVETDVVVTADKSLLMQVLLNLASNAMRYNKPDGYIRFKLREKDGMGVLRVVNSGPQIDPEDSERIFDRFYKVQKPGKERSEGSGLGLSLAREIARAHGGELDLEASLKNMNVFRLRLPLSSKVKDFRKSSKV